MSSQASSAGHGEKEVRRKLVETGDVDVMIAIRSNFFYTRTVPCELWHFDRAKPAERKDRVLMLDARNVYRKVTRKIYDFSPEQQANLAAIVWLYRGQQARFLGLVQDYFDRLIVEAAAIAPTLAALDTALAAARKPLAAFEQSPSRVKSLPKETGKPLSDALAEWSESDAAYRNDSATLVAQLDKFERGPHPKSAEQSGLSVKAVNDKQHETRERFDPLASAMRGLIKQIDLLFKLATRAAQAALNSRADDAATESFDRRAGSKLMKQLDEARKTAVEQMKATAYLHRQIVWLHERFPNAEMQDVLGLCKVVTRTEIEAADWSLTPGRFVGVAPAEVDEEFDFEQTMRDIHVELGDLNREAVELAKNIQESFEGLGV